MKLLYDYFYRFPGGHLQMPGRCRVRIYKRKNDAHTVLLTELDTNAGESIASACERIATALAAAKGLNPQTTRWIQHDPPHDGLPHAFDELEFTWSSHHKASNPQWQHLSDEQAEALTGERLVALERQLGDGDEQIKAGAKDEATQIKGSP